MAASRQSTQNPAYIVFDSRHTNTLRVPADDRNRYTKPCNKQPNVADVSTLRAELLHKALQNCSLCRWHLYDDSLDSMKYARFDYFKTLDQFFEPFPIVAFALTALIKPLEKQPFYLIHKAVEVLKVSCHAIVVIIAEQFLFNFAKSIFFDTLLIL